MSAVEADVDSTGLARVRIDDGRVNVLGAKTIADIRSSLAYVLDASRAVVLIGRTGCFSAGLDRELMTSASDAERASLLADFAALLRIILLYPRPVVAAVTGHAIAGGAMLALACDEVVADSGPCRWGLVETRVGVAQSKFGLALATYRLGPASDRWVLRGSWMTPQDALRAGAVDELVASDDVVLTAVGRAKDLGQIDAAAYSITKQRLHKRLCHEMGAEFSPTGAKPRGDLHD